MSVDVRLAIPGHRVTLPDGRDAWLMHEDLRVEEVTRGGDFALYDPELPGPVVIPITTVRAAASQVANLLVAIRKEARDLVRESPTVPFDEHADEVLAEMVARALRGMA